MLFPLVVIAFLLGETVVIVTNATRPLAEGLPFDAVTSTVLVIALGLGAVVVVSFLAGFLLNTFWGTTLKNWLEKKLLERIPMYTTLRGLTQRFAGIENADFPIVEADLHDSDDRVLGLLVDTLPDQRGVVYIPSSPIITVGQVHILPKSRITETRLSMSETIGCLSQMGFEASKLYAIDSNRAESGQSQ